LAPDAAAALAAARQEPRIDLLFTDVVLPKGVGGRELAEQLAGERGGVKVLYTSGYSADIIERRGQMGPALRLLTKPYTTAELAAAVAAALRDPDVLGGQAHESA
jgi:CheY-like chemotaxis protein